MQLAGIVMKSVHSIMSMWPGSHARHLHVLYARQEL